ncbi:acyl carrier protein [Alteromonas sp. a30]|nr:acyl carrier protein [Alteromonas sp. a30]
MFSDKDNTVISSQDDAAIKAWLMQRLAKHLKKDINELDSATPFEQYGLDSMFAVRVTGELEKVVELRLSPALFFENSCIDEVVSEITGSTPNS